MATVTEVRGEIDAEVAGPTVATWFADVVAAPTSSAATMKFERRAINSRYAQGIVYAR